METRGALFRAVGVSVYKIARVLRIRRQSVEPILGRRHVAAMVEDFRKRFRAHGLPGNGDLDWWLGEF